MLPPLNINHYHLEYGFKVEQQSIQITFNPFGLVSWNVPPLIPKPPDVWTISMTVFSPQLWHFPLTCIEPFPELSANILLIFSNNAESDISESLVVAGRFANGRLKWNSKSPANLHQQGIGFMLWKTIGAWYDADQKRLQLRQPPAIMRAIRQSVL